MSRKPRFFSVFSIFSILAILTGPLPHASASCNSILRGYPARFDAYTTDTDAGLERLRNAETGLIQDKIEIVADVGNPTVRVLNANTSPTNVALDLIRLASATDGASAKRLAQVLHSLARMERHPDSGLFYSWYATDASLAVKSRDVSSVDNIHLALALWTIAATHSGQEGKLARSLLKTMDFSDFYDSKTGLMGGNLKYQNGEWNLEAYRFDQFGSEARSIYAVVYALKLLKKTPDSSFLKKSVEALNAEVFLWKDGTTVRPILRTWDGGAFQLLLPKLLLNEEKYSPELARIFENYARYTRVRAREAKLPVPAAYSACNYGVEGSGSFHGPDYWGKAGSPELVSLGHQDVKNASDRALWDEVFTPHAAFLAATADPKAFGPWLKHAESLRSGKNTLYVRGFGFMDGYHVRGADQGRVVPVQLSLDQGMIALALQQIEDSHGYGFSGKALSRDPEASARLKRFYQAIDRKLKRVINASETNPR